MSNPAEPPLRWLGEYARQYPDAWRHIDWLRTERGKGVPNWPNWCFVPIAGGIAAVTNGRDLPRGPTIEEARDGGIVTALATWRQTKGVYRFDEALLDALWDTPVTGDLPAAVLKRLPEWCVYVHVDREISGGQRLHGAWAFLESDANDSSEELRLVFAIDDGIEGFPIDLGGTLREGIDSVIGEGIMRTRRVFTARQVDAVGDVLRQLTEPIVSLVLYLCSDAPEIEGKGRPGNPQPTRVKGGFRVFPVQNPRLWTVGSRIGAALRAVSEHERGDGETVTGRARPRPHIRRAHWAVRWTGPRTNDQTAVLRWIAPTLVAADTDDELPAVIHPVEP